MAIQGDDGGLAVGSYPALGGRTNPAIVTRLWNRQLSRYPNNGPRAWYLAITVIATIVLYYEFYIQGAVATKIITDLHMSFSFFVLVAVAGNGVGAFGSLAAGVADRWGRANIVTYGLLILGLLTLVGLPHAPNKGSYMVLFAVMGVVEGALLVATPALIRDFSPQVGRAVAMGFWTMGPVLGSLVVTEVSSHTLKSHPDWQFQFYVCGIVGLVVFVLALFGLRELSPPIRSQLMVSLRDRALIEARAAGLSPEELMKGQWRQLFRFNVVGPAFAISIFLLFYYIAVGFFVVYFATVFGYSESRANSLANWYWITNAIALLVAGILSDKIRVRKPFMVVGACISLIGVGLFTVAATHPNTGYYTFAGYMIIMAAGGGVAYCAWMAAFTETVERHNPAATATGLAYWGWIIRAVVTISLAVFMTVVPATSTLVDQGPRAQAIQAKYPKQVATLSALDPATSAALTKNPLDPKALPVGLAEVARSDGATPAKAAQVKSITTKRFAQLETASAIDPKTLATLTSNPTDAAAIAKAQSEIAKTFKISSSAAFTRLAALAAPAVKSDLAVILPYVTQLQNASAQIPKDDLAFLQKHGAKITKAQQNSPSQWQHWWWVCFGGQVIFIPFIFVLTGRWDPRKAREDELEHERFVQREMAALSGGPGGSPPREA